MQTIDWLYELMRLNFTNKLTATNVLKLSLMKNKIVQIIFYIYIKYGLWLNSKIIPIKSQKDTIYTINVEIVKFITLKCQNNRG